MVLYFVCKLKLVSKKPGKENVDKNKITVLSYSYDDSDAWTKVKHAATEYMKKKNTKMCDQTNSSQDEVKCVNEVYVIRESKLTDDKVNTIEVYKLWKEKIRGYVTTTYKDREMKVAEFSVAKFSDVIGCGMCGKEHTVENKPDVRAIASVIKSLDPRMLKELKECDLFKERIRQVDKYSKREDIDSSTDDESD